MIETLEQARQRLIDCETPARMVCPDCGGERIRHWYRATVWAEVTRWQVNQYGEIVPAEEGEDHIDYDNLEAGEPEFQCLNRDCEAEW